MIAYTFLNPRGMFKTLKITNLARLKSINIYADGVFDNWKTLETEKNIFVIETFQGLYKIPPHQYIRI